MRNFFPQLKHFDLPLLLVSGLLLATGLVMLYATSVGGDTLQTFYRQLIFAAFGIAVFFLMSFYNYHKLAKQNRVIYVILILVLIALLIFGREIRGSTGWIDFGLLSIQPAEFAKVIIILGLSRWLYLRRGQINSWKNIAITFLYTLLPTALIALEPDFGSAAIIMSIWFGLLLVSPMRKTYLVGFLMLAVLAAGVTWQFILQDYQKTRVEVFLNPELDPRGRGYNVRQAIIAVGSGQVTGRGLGRGLQSQLKFLPERQTDFIFASAAEEIGLIGSLALLGLYYYLIHRLIKIMKYAKDDLGYYITAGVLFLFLVQFIINIGMNMGILPVTGIPLPFLTYGGSSLLVSFIALGIVQNVTRQSRILRF